MANGISAMAILAGLIMMFTQCCRSRTTVSMALKLGFEISPEVISTEVQLEETLLMNTRTLAYFGLDPLGSQFWRAMQLQPDADEVVRMVAEQTGNAVDLLERKLQSIITGMERSGILRITRY